MVGRSAVLPHEQTLANEIIRAVARYTAARDVWRRRACAASASKQLEAVGLSDEMPRADAKRILEDLCGDFGLASDPNDQAKRVSRALRELSTAVESEKGPRKAQQRAVAALFDTDGLGKDSVAKAEKLSPFEVARMRSTSTVESTSTLELAKAASERAQDVGRALVLREAISQGVDVAPLLTEKAEKAVDIELFLANRARIVSSQPQTRRKKA